MSANFSFLRKLVHTGPNSNGFEPVLHWTHVIRETMRFHTDLEKERSKVTRRFSKKKMLQKKILVLGVKMPLFRSTLTCLIQGSITSTGSPSEAPRL